MAANKYRPIGAISRLAIRLTFVAMPGVSLAEIARTFNVSTALVRRHAKGLERVGLVKELPALRVIWNRENGDHDGTWALSFIEACHKAQGTILDSLPETVSFDDGGMDPDEIGRRHQECVMAKANLDTDADAFVLRLSRASEPVFDLLARAVACHSNRPERIAA